jgi:hypothetical protein
MSGTVVPSALAGEARDLVDWHTAEMWNSPKATAAVFD